jgi:hypothetical protein
MAKRTKAMCRKVGDHCTLYNTLCGSNVCCTSRQMWQHRQETEMQQSGGMLLESCKRQMRQCQVYVGMFQVGWKTKKCRDKGCLWQKEPKKCVGR